MQDITQARSSAQTGLVEHIITAAEGGAGGRKSGKGGGSCFLFHRAREGSMMTIMSSITLKYIVVIHVQWSPPPSSVSSN